MYPTAAPPAMKIRVFLLLEAGGRATAAKPADVLPKFAIHVDPGQNQCADRRGSKEPNR